MARGVQFRRQLNNYIFLTIEKGDTGMKRTTLALTGAALLLMAIPQANAQTFTYADNWVNWPGPHHDIAGLPDENGTPKIDHMDVSINGGYLDSVSIVLHDSPSRQHFDSLFISTDGAWDSWNYFVHDGGYNHSDHTDGTIPDDGLYKVANPDNYDYTYVKDINRVGNPNGIDKGSLSSVDGGFGATQNGYNIVYDFSTKGIQINPDEFFIAYAPWCDNDIIGGGTAPVPEPATMLLFGTGLAGLATVGRKKMKRD